MCSQFIQNIVLHTDGDRNLSVFEHTLGTQIEVCGLQVAHYRAVLLVLNSLTVHTLFCVLFDLILFLSADTVKSPTIESSSTGNRNIHELKLPVWMQKKMCIAAIYLLVRVIKTVRSCANKKDLYDSKLGAVVVKVTSGVASSQPWVRPIRLASWHE